MKTEGVDLKFKESGIVRIAEIAWEVNQSNENIGARRLHTVMERLLEDISYEANGNSKVVEIDAKYVDQQLGELAQDEDMAKYIL